MRFIATADWQLGMKAHYLDDDARPRYLRARLDAVRRIGELAGQRGADFVVVCGDVFETNQLDRRIIDNAFESLRSFPVPVLLLPGNHDPLDAASLYDSPAFAEHQPDVVRVIRDSRPVPVAPGVEVVGAPWSSKRPDCDLVARALEDLEPAPPGVVRVLAGHGRVSTLNPDAADPGTIDVSGLTRALAADLVQVVVLGDRHGTYEVAPSVWYPGTPEVTDRDEVDPGNALVVDVDTDTRAVSVEKVHVGRWRYEVLAWELGSGADVDALDAHLDALQDKDSTAVWLRLTGTLTLSARAHLEDVLDRHRGLFAHLDHWQRHTDLAVVPDDHDFADLALGGFADAAVAELVGTARGGGDGAVTVQDALGLLHRLAGGGVR